MTESSLRIQDSVNIMIFSLCIIIYLMYGASQDVSSGHLLLLKCAPIRALEGEMSLIVLTFSARGSIII